MPDANVDDFLDALSDGSIPSELGGLRPNAASKIKREPHEEPSPPEPTTKHEPEPTPAAGDKIPSRDGGLAGISTSAVKEDPVKRRALCKYWAWFHECEHNADAMARMCGHECRLVKKNQIHLFQLPGGIPLTFESFLTLPGGVVSFESHVITYGLKVSKPDVLLVL